MLKSNTKKFKKKVQDFIINEYGSIGGTEEEAKKYNCCDTTEKMADLIIKEIFSNVH